MFWVYILRCSDNSYYTGHTDNLTLRLAKHDSGSFPGNTKSRRPLELVFRQGFPERIDALKAERQIKGWNKKKKEALIAGDWNAIRKYASRRKS